MNQDFFAKNIELIIAEAKSRGNTIHVIGPVGEDNERLVELIALFRKNGAKRVIFHGITRDIIREVESLPLSVRNMELSLLRIGGSKISSLSGVFYAEDGDRDMARIQKVFNTLVKGLGNISDEGPAGYVEGGIRVGIRDDMVMPCLFAMEYEEPVIIQQQSVVVCCAHNEVDISLLTTMVREFVSENGSFFLIDINK